MVDPRTQAYLREIRMKLDRQVQDAVTTAGEDKEVMMTKGKIRSVLMYHIYVNMGKRGYRRLNTGYSIRIHEI